jgi:integrase/recombinase XerD
VQWATDHGVGVMEASRAHVDLFRAWMENRVLAASTIDRRLSTVCGFYRFAHIDGRIRSTPTQYVRQPQVHASEAPGLDRSELGVFLFAAEQYDPGHAALAMLVALTGLRVSEVRATNIEDLGFERGHRTLGIVGKGNTPATVPLVLRAGPDDRPGGRGAPRGSDPAAPGANASTGAPRISACARSGSGPVSVPCIRTCCEPR